MEKRLSSFYLVIAIIGIITAIPLLGSVVDFYRIATFVLLGFSIYVLVKQPKEKVNRTAAILMIVSCALTLLASLVMMGTLGAADLSGDMSSYETGQQIGGLLGGSILTILLAFPAWVLKIIAIVYAFKASKELKEDA